MQMAKFTRTLETSKLSDYTEEQAKAKGKIFHQAWLDYKNAQLEKNRKKIRKILDQKHKM